MRAFKIYGLVKACGPAATRHLWAATQAWVEDAEKHNHPSVLEAYQTSLNTLDHLTSMQSSLDSRHEIMQARVANLTNNIRKFTHYLTYLTALMALS